MSGTNWRGENELDAASLLRFANRRKSLTCNSPNRAVTTETTTAANDAKVEKLWLCRKEVSKMTGLSVSWLETMARIGKGPPCFKVGREVRYNKAKAKKWMDDQEAQSAA